MPDLPLVLSLDQVGIQDRHIVGAKASTLGALRQAGLPVPRGFCLTVDAVRLLSSGEQTQAGDKPTGEALAALEEALSTLALPPVAVRSSAMAEDGVSASFAGQFDTFLNLRSRTSILGAILDCWAARSKDAVAAYQRSLGTKTTNEMAVLVQEQVKAEAAGVLFTLNPLNGHEDEMVVEAVWGLGLSLVSGMISPEQYVVNTESGSVRAFRPGKQEWMIVASPEEGTSAEPLPATLRDKRVLDDVLVRELVRLGIRAQEELGYPLDIEWALADGKLYLLQARPITRVNFEHGPEQWTSGNYREVLPGFPCPLSISLSLMHEYGPALADLFRRLRMGKPDNSIQWGRVFFGRPYWNVTAVKRYNAIIPGFNERAFDATVGIEPTYQGDGMVTPWTLRTALRAVPVLLSLLWYYGALLRRAKRFCAWFEHKVWPALKGSDLAPLSLEALKAEVLRAMELHKQANMLAMHISFLCAQAESDFAVMMEWVNSRLAPEEKIPESDLLTGLASVRTAAPTIDLWDLAQWIRRRPGLVEAFEKNVGTGALHMAEVGATQGDWAELRQRFQALVQQYCYMAEVDEDLSYPRWDEDIELPLKMVRMYLAADPSADPRRKLAEQEQLREEAEEKARRVLARGWRKLWLWPRLRFYQQLRLVRRYIWWREETRVVASRVFYHCRRVFLELGRRWCASGLILRPEDIFMLNKEQILAGLDNKLSPNEARQAVEHYWRTRRLYRNFTPPCTIGRGLTMVEQKPSSAWVLQGVPCSSGVAIGKARVVRRLEETAALQRGEILVAPYTNPGWTPLLNLAAGLVIEEGGLLSHGAVVAREYGVPTVLRVTRATELLRTGQLLRVDGFNGTVEVLDSC